MADELGSAPGPSGGGERKLHVSVISPASVGYTGEGDSVIAPAYDGLLGILVGHAPMMVLLGEGDVVVKDGAEEHRVHVSGGFLQVIDDEVSVLAERVGEENGVDPAGASGTR